MKLLLEENQINGSAQRAVWRQSGCVFADILVVIWKLTARRNLSETPPERQAAWRCVQCGGSVHLNKRR